MQTPDYDAEFQRAIQQWRGRYRIKEDDTVMLMLELFRIHQDHWDGIRQRDTMGLLEFRQMVEKQNASMKTFQRHVDTVSHLLVQRHEEAQGPGRRHHGGHNHIFDFGLGHIDREILPLR